MKILILANSDSGLYEFRRELVQELINPGSYLNTPICNKNEIYVSLPNNGYRDKIEALGCTFIETKINRRGVNPIEDIKLYNHYIKILKDIKPDIVLTYTIKPNIYGGLACQKLNIPYFTTITGLGSAFQKENLQKKLIVFLYKLGLKKVKKVFFLNEENKNIFIKNNIIVENKSVMLPGEGVNCEQFSFKDYPLNNDKLNFLFIGRIMKEKGVDELLYCIEKLNEKYNNLSFSFIGNYEDNYKDIIEDFQNRKLINYYGYQSDVKPFIEKANCVVIPSYHEGLCISLLESGAIGRPVVTTDIFGCKETVIDGESGFLCKPKDKESLYNTLIKFIETSYINKVEMGKTANKFIYENFNRKKVIEKVINNLY